MQFSKLFSAVIAVVFFTGPAARAEDTPAQAAARAALMEKMSEVDAQQNTSAPVTVDANGVVPTPPVAPAAPAVPVPAPAAVESTPAPVAPAVESVPTNSSGDNAAQAAARAALLEKLNTANQQPAVSAPVLTPVVAAPSASAATVEPVIAPAPAPIAAPVAPVKPVPVMNYPGKDLGLKPIVAPELPISTTKEARLEALLQQYKTDQITPEQYHTQRAAILAEP